MFAGRLQHAFALGAPTGSAGGGGIGLPLAALALVLVVVAAGSLLRLAGFPQRGRAV